MIFLFFFFCFFFALHSGRFYSSSKPSIEYFSSASTCLMCKGSFLLAECLYTNTCSFLMPAVLELWFLILTAYYDNTGSFKKKKKIPALRSLPRTTE